MNLRSNIQAKMLNAMLTGKDFENRDVEEYIYASLTQPPIKIIDKCDSDDEMEYIVECPNCKSHIKYGEHTYMLSGHIYCDTEGCRESLVNKDLYLREKYGWEYENER